MPLPSSFKNRQKAEASQKQTEQKQQSEPSDETVAISDESQQFLVNFHHFATIFRGVVECGRPMRMDNELITALIERWRPETHCFHLLGLRADGRVFTGRDYPIGYEDWPSKCRDWLGWIPDAETETKQGGLLMTSLIHQATIPLGDGLHEYAYIQRARIHALILLGRLIIPDTTGCKVPFMWLNAFDDPEEVANISWGSAALAFLYHYLCEAYVGRHKRDVGGPMVLLQLWAWERMPTLRPAFLISPMHMPYTPCGAKWHRVTEIGNAPRHSVAHYRDQLSLIRPGQFLWTPYADCILPDYCIDSTASFLCDTYLVCWSFVEAHEAGRDI
ncbi:serine/threonine-protein phosphatase 7 long form homolog [Salvia splendens]|uniref:serine/threonine-protein phosphatase 7 long form homolog n=1 Tax=Salvia splendens TaxID=180675 RepID=UPI001C2645F8|nr:serine/threonine-protein phosphatase 7 long form homolog [Salvia splendens]